MTLTKRSGAVINCVCTMLVVLLFADSALAAPKKKSTKAQAPAAAETAFPSNADLASKNVALWIDEFSFASGINKDAKGNPNCNGIELLKGGGWGSGFVIKPDGTLVTNYHVARRALGLKAMYKDGATYEINHLMLYDPENDLAILKIRGSKNFPAVDLGDSKKAEPQDGVLAVGNPQGMGLNVSPGQISQVTNYDNGLPYRIQHTAVIAPGNSGGALYKGKKVIGVNVAKGMDVQYGGGSGFNVAIPIDTVKTLLSNPQNNQTPIPFESVFPTTWDGMSKKSAQIFAQNGQVPAKNGDKPGMLGFPLKMYKFDDLMLALKTQSSNVAVVVFDSGDKLIGCGAYNADFGFAPLLLSSDYPQDAVIGVLNFDDKPVDVGLGVYQIKW